MAVLFMNSPTSREGAYKYDSYGAQAYNAGNTPYGGDSMRFEANVGHVADKIIDPTVSSLMVSFLGQFTAAQDGGVNNYTVMFKAEGEGRHLWFAPTSDGRVRVRRDDNQGTALATSAPGIISFGSWHHWEIRATLSATVGIVQVWIDGQLVIDESALNTQGAGSATVWNGFEFHRTTTGFFYVADHVIRDDTAQMGVTRVTPLVVTADGTHSAFTPSTGTDHYALVDEQTPNSDTDYVASGVEGTKDSFAIADLPTGTWDVKAIQVSAVTRRFDPGTKFLRTFVRTGAADFVGDSEILSENYKSVMHIWDQNPDTLAAWTESEVDGLEIGVEVRDS